VKNANGSEGSVSYWSFVSKAIKGATNISFSLGQSIVSTAQARRVGPSAASVRRGILVPGDGPPTNAAGSFRDYREVLLPEQLAPLRQGIFPLGRAQHPGKDAPDFNTDAFVASINAYNRRYDAREDADYGRPFNTMVPVRRGPFYALKIGPTYFNTMGGPRRNKYAQIVNVSGYPIQGLFSAGELGSIFCDMYNGSGNLGETMVFGRIAGQNAALRSQGQFSGETKEAIIWQGPTEDLSDISMVAGTFRDGVYEGSGTGFGGKINVSVTISGGKIANIEVLNHAETPAIGGVALPGYIRSIVNTQGFDVDATSGASNTLQGFKEAVNNALSKARR
jgi:uncharacterized protein with FMN-binding domain